MKYHTIWRSDMPGPWPTACWAWLLICPLVFHSLFHLRNIISNIIGWVTPKISSFLTNVFSLIDLSFHLLPSALVSRRWNTGYRYSNHPRSKTFLHYSWQSGLDVPTTSFLRSTSTFCSTPTTQHDRDNQCRHTAFVWLCRILLLRY